MSRTGYSTPRARTARFDTEFAGRSRIAQPVASQSWIDHGGVSAFGVGTGVKFNAALMIILGGATLLLGGPLSAAGLLGIGVVGHMGGSALKAAGKTYGQALQAGAEGKQESGTKIVERFRDNFKAGLYKPW